MDEQFETWWDRVGIRVIAVREYLAHHLQEAATQLLAAAGLAWRSDWEIVVEQPAHREHGDYATNLAMRLAPVLHRSPVQIAQALQPALDQLPLVARTEVARPGFLNLFLDWQAWAHAAAASETRGTTTANGDQAAAFPREKQQRAHQKIVVEHTSINPNKAAHIGHLRNSCIGDTLSRLLRRVGYPVEVHNYIDDLGNQVADTVVGLLYVTLEGQYPRFSDYCWDLYAQVNQAYQSNEALRAHRTQVQKALEAGGNNVSWIATLVVDRIVRDHLQDMASFGIHYDLLVHEYDIVHSGFWAAAFQKLQQSSLFVKEAKGKYAGCWVLKQPATTSVAGQPAAADANATATNVNAVAIGANDAATHTAPAPADSSGNGGEEPLDSEFNPDKVLVRSNGVLTYTAKDIAYHLWKFGLLGRDFRYRPFEDGIWTTAQQGEPSTFGRASRVLNVIDKRQEYPQAMVRLALQTLGFPEAAAHLHHVSYGVVSLSPATAARLGVDTSDGRSSYPMSGRQGIGIKVSDLLDEMEKTVEAVRPRKEGIPSREVAAAAIRYFLLRFSLLTEIVFDFDQAADLHGNSGVYLMYQHARAAKILRDGGWPAAASQPSEQSEKRSDGAPNQRPGCAADAGSTQVVPTVPSQLLPAEHALLRHLADWPDTLERAASDLNITLLPAYAFELASLFSTFYDAAPVLKAPEPLRSFRLWMVAQTRQTLADALGVLGLPAPDQM